MTYSLDLYFVKPDKEFPGPPRANVYVKTHSKDKDGPILITPNCVSLIELEYEIPEGSSRISMPEGSRELVTSWGKPGYDGPQPPVGSGNHEYVFRLYALDVPKMDVPENIPRSQFLDAIEGHVITEETYSGFFER